MSETNLPLPPELGRLSTFIDSHTDGLAGPNGELRSIALYAVKHIFDWALETEKSSKPHLGILLSTLTEATPPQTRSQARRTSTRKRSPSSVQKSSKKIDTRETPLPSLFTEGMNIEQIWQQLDLRAARVCENLQILLGDGDGDRVTASSDGEDGDDAESEEEDEDEDDAEEMDIDEDDSVWEELSGEEDGSLTAEGVVDLRDEISEDDEDDGPPTSMSGIIRGQKPRSPASCSHGHLDLDDGFFDLATFNAETNELEANKRKPNSIADEDSVEESEVDLFASVDDSTIESVDDGIEIFYNDFFEPPSRAQNRSVRSSKVRFHEQVSIRKIKAVGKGMPVSFMDDEDSDEDSDADSDDDSS